MAWWHIPDMPCLLALALNTTVLWLLLLLFGSDHVSELSLAELLAAVGGGGGVGGLLADGALVEGAAVLLGHVLAALPGHVPALLSWHVLALLLGHLVAHLPGHLAALLLGHIPTLLLRHPGAGLLRHIVAF